MTPPVGAAGIAYCSGDEPTPPKWRLGAAYTYSFTTIEFSNGDKPADLRKLGFMLTLERQLSDRLSVQGAIGATILGDVRLLGTTHDILPGPTASAALSYRLLDGRGAQPFVFAGVSLGASSASTRERGAAESDTNGLYSFDGRLSVTVGKTFFHALSPYASARAFGLPVFWNFRGEDLIGGDKYHYQVAFGLSLRVGGADVLVEYAPIGEGAVTAGAGLAF